MLTQQDISFAYHDMSRCLFFKMNSGDYFKNEFLIGCEDRPGQEERRRPGQQNDNRSLGKKARGSIVEKNRKNIVSVTLGCHSKKP